MCIDLNSYEASFYSQNGEDGLLKEIFLRIGTTNRFVVEIGIESGIECNSAFWIREYGWGGLLVDGDHDGVVAARELYSATGAVVHEEYVDADNVNGIMRKYQVPVALHLLSIDIDGNDYWIWSALSSFRPRVVVIEYNATRVPPELWVMKYNPVHRWARDDYFGASLASLTCLGIRRGYALLATDRNGVNAFFLRRDLLTTSGLTERSPIEAYHPLFVQHPHGDGPFDRV